MQGKHSAKKKYKVNRKAKYLLRQEKRKVHECQQGGAKVIVPADKALTQRRLVSKQSKAKYKSVKK